MKEPWRTISSHISEGLVLDAGCGEMRYTRLLKRRYGEKIEIIPLDLIAIPDLGYQFVQGNIMSLPFRDESFDAIICLSTLQLVEDDRKALEEFHRVLRRGGKVIITVPTKYSPFHIIRELEITCNVYDYEPFNIPGYKYYSRTDLSKLISGLFELVEIKSYNFNFLPRLRKLIVRCIERVLGRNKAWRSKEMYFEEWASFMEEGKAPDNWLASLFKDLGFHYIVVLRKRD